MDVRGADPADLENVVSLTRARRADLARWAPVYFNPSDGADEGHAWFLEFMIASDEHDTHVLVINDQVCGFFVCIAQRGHTWIDDLCIREDALWPEALDSIEATATRPWVTCVPWADRTTSGALQEHGLRSVSSYWARSVEPTTSPSELDFVMVERDTTAVVPAHTFGGRPFAPDTPGAFALVNQSGYAIGSPSATPPIYDPGGPTTVIDQIVGRDRTSIVEDSLRAAAGRGDAQVVVVVDAQDIDLAHIVESSGFSRVVDLYGSPGSVTPRGPVLVYG